MEFEAVKKIKDQGKMHLIFPINLNFLADAAGFEPATSGLEGQRLIQARPHAHER